PIRHAHPWSAYPGRTSPPASRRGDIRARHRKCYFRPAGGASGGPGRGPTSDCYTLSHRGGRPLHASSVGGDRRLRHGGTSAAGRVAPGPARRRSSCAWIPEAAASTARRVIGGTEGKGSEYGERS